MHWLNVDGCRGEENSLWWIRETTVNLLAGARACVLLRIVDNAGLRIVCNCVLLRWILICQHHQLPTVVRQNAHLVLSPFAASEA